MVVYKGLLRPVIIWPFLARLLKLDRIKIRAGIPRPRRGGCILLCAIYPLVRKVFRPVAANFCKIVTWPLYVSRRKGEVSRGSSDYIVRSEVVTSWWFRSKAQSDKRVHNLLIKGYSHVTAPLCWLAVSNFANIT